MGAIQMPKTDRVSSPKAFVLTSQSFHCPTQHKKHFHSHSFHSPLPNPLITIWKFVMFTEQKNWWWWCQILVLYVDIRIVCPAKTYSQLSNANSQCSGKTNEIKLPSHESDSSLFSRFFLYTLAPAGDDCDVTRETFRENSKNDSMIRIIFIKNSWFPSSLLLYVSFFTYSLLPKHSATSFLRFVSPLAWNFFLPYVSFLGLAGRRQTRKKGGERKSNKKKN